MFGAAPPPKLAKSNECLACSRLKRDRERDRIYICILRHNDRRKEDEKSIKGCSGCLFYWLMWKLVYMRLRKDVAQALWKCAYVHPKFSTQLREWAWSKETEREREGGREVEMNVVTIRMRARTCTTYTHICILYKYKYSKSEWHDCNLIVALLFAVHIHMCNRRIYAYIFSFLSFSHSLRFYRIRHSRLCTHTEFVIPFGSAHIIAVFTLTSMRHWNICIVKPISTYKPHNSCSYIRYVCVLCIIFNQCTFLPFDITCRSCILFYSCMSDIFIIFQQNKDKKSEKKQK